MLDEQILALELKLEELEGEKMKREEHVKDIKSEIATIKRAIKTMSTLTEKLND